MNDLDDFLFLQSQERKFTRESMVAGSEEERVSCTKSIFLLRVHAQSEPLKTIGALRLLLENRF